MKLTMPASWELRGQNLLLACLLIFLAAVLIYSPAFKFDFSNYDDSKIIGGQPHLFSEGTIGERVNRILFESFPREEPLLVRDLSWLLDSELFGFNRPFGYHFGNIVYHALALVLAFLLLLRLTNPKTALISSAILLVLASHIEPVVWTMGRKDVLSAMFTLMSILSLFKFQEAEGWSRKAFFYTASLILFAAATLSKINAVVHAGILYLCALINDGRILRKGIGLGELTRLGIRMLIPMIPFLATGLITFLWYQSVLEQFGLLGAALEYSPSDLRKVMFLVNPLIFLEYLKIVLFPSNLEAYYTAPSLFSDFSGSEVALALVVLVLTVAITALLWRLNRLACLLLLCFLLALLPYGNWWHFGFWYANRYVYFGSIFLIAALVYLLTSSKPDNGGRLIQSCGMLFLVWIFVHNTLYRSHYMGVWEDGISLWTHEISLPGAAIIDYNNMTAMYLDEARVAPPEERQDWVEKARAINDLALKMEAPAQKQEWLAFTHYFNGIILSYSDAPLTEQLSEFLLGSSTLITYAPAQWSTGVVYYQMALEETQSDKRNELAKISLSYFQRNFELEERNPSPVVRKEAFLEQFERDFPDVLLSDAEESESR